MQQKKQYKRLIGKMVNVITKDAILNSYKLLRVNQNTIVLKKKKGMHNDIYVMKDTIRKVELI